jgi:3-methylcrotonyl-CoA carboxylase alpha subunit
VDYQGAGTIEFIADASEGLRADRIWFMEMNTRLQVEHPVTEEITGVDLVELQLRVASGEPLPLRQDEIKMSGHAIEARLYAEDPAKGFLPSIGTLELFELGEVDGGRIDTGVHEGGAVTPYYDPMIAKLIAHGDTRGEARERLSAMLHHSAVWPVRTNAAFLINALDHADFVAGNIDTGLIGRDGDALSADPEPSAEMLTETAMSLVTPTFAPGFRLNAQSSEVAKFLLDGVPLDIALDGQGTGDGETSVLVAENGKVWQLAQWRVDGVGHHGAHDGEILSPMPGKVISVEVAAGQTVTKGQKLLTLEAMKMEHTLAAPFDGTVAQLTVTPGDQVQVEALLVRIEPSAD